MEKERESRKEQRWRVEPYVGSYLSCNRTCLPSLITPIPPPMFSPLPPSFHPFTPSCPSSFIPPSLTTLGPLHPDSLIITSHSLPYQTTLPRSAFTTPLTHFSNVADLLIWVVVFPETAGDQTAGRELQVLFPHLTSCQWIKSSIGAQHLTPRAFQNLYLSIRVKCKIRGSLENSVG